MKLESTNHACGHAIVMICIHPYSFACWLPIFLSLSTITQIHSWHAWLVCAIKSIKMLFNCHMKFPKAIVTYLAWVSNFKSNIWVDTHKHPFYTNMTYQIVDACGRTLIRTPQTCRGWVILTPTKDMVLSVWDLGTNYCFMKLTHFQCHNASTIYVPIRTCVQCIVKEEWSVCTLLLLCVMKILMPFSLVQYATLYSIMYHYCNACVICQ